MTAAVVPENEPEAMLSAWASGDMTANRSNVKILRMAIPPLNVCDPGLVPARRIGALWDATAAGLAASGLPATYPMSCGDLEEGSVHSGAETNRYISRST